MIDTLLELHIQSQNQSPLIHCLTNHITINDCANVILAVGGKPIMAEHPKEVSDITKMAGALCINLGNITDDRMTSMEISGETAKNNKIPILIDLVGIGCSPLRLDFAKKFIISANPQILKGNMSEIKALLGTSQAQGIDVGLEDMVLEENLLASGQALQRIAKQYNCIVVATGKIDLVASPKEVYAIRNGCKTLSLVTGTGCMVGSIISSYMAIGDPLCAALLGTSLMGIAGEINQEIKGVGSFKISLMDAISTITQETIAKYIHLERIDTSWN